MLGRAQPVSGTWAGVGEQSLLSQAAATGHHPHHGDPTTSNPRSPGLRWDQPWAAWTPHPDPKGKGRGLSVLFLRTMGAPEGMVSALLGLPRPHPSKCLMAPGIPVLTQPSAIHLALWLLGHGCRAPRASGPQAHALCLGCQATVL